MLPREKSGQFEGKIWRYHWKSCLANYPRDVDFPRAYARGLQADPRLPTAKQYQSRHKALTAPEEVLEWPEDAFADLLGAGRRTSVCRGAAWSAAAAPEQLSVWVQLLVRSAA